MPDLANEPTYSEETRALLRRTAALFGDADRRPLPHPGQLCGPKRPCPRGCRTDVRTVERLANGRITCHWCLRVWLTPLDPEYAEFAKAFLP